jgi:ribosomal protein L12E/L44/L45/RPP1/RPP2
VENSTEPPDARLQSIEEAICNIGDGVTAIAERLAASAQQQQQDEEKEADNIVSFTKCYKREHQYAEKAHETSC